MNQINNTMEEPLHQPLYNESKYNSQFLDKYQNPANLNYQQGDFNMYDPSQHYAPFDIPKYTQNQPRPEQVPYFLQSQNNVLLNSQLHNHPSVVAKRAENQYNYSDFQKERNFKIMDYLSKAQNQLEKELRDHKVGSWEHRRIRSELDNVYNIRKEKEKEFKGYKNLNYTENVPKLPNVQISQIPNYRQQNQADIQFQTNGQKQLYNSVDGFKVSIDFALSLPVELQKVKVFYGISKKFELASINNSTDSYPTQKSNYRSRTCFIDHKDLVRQINPDYNYVIYFELWGEEEIPPPVMYEDKQSGIQDQLDKLFLQSSAVYNYSRIQSQSQMSKKDSEQKYSKYWTCMPLFNAQDDFEAGAYKVPIYNIKYTVRQLYVAKESGHGIPQVFDSHLFIRLGTANDPSIEQPWGLNRQDEYILHKDHFNTNKNLKNPLLTEQQTNLDQDYLKGIQQVYTQQKYEIARLMGKQQEAAAKVNIPTLISGKMRQPDYMTPQQALFSQDDPATFNKDENEGNSRMNTYIPQKNRQQPQQQQDDFVDNLLNNINNQNNTQQSFSKNSVTESNQSKQQSQNSNQQEKNSEKSKDNIQNNQNDQDSQPDTNNENQDDEDEDDDDENFLQVEIIQLFNFSSRSREVACNWIIVDEKGPLKNMKGEILMETKDVPIKTSEGKKNIIFNEKHIIPVTRKQIIKAKNNSVENVFIIFQCSANAISMQNYMSRGIGEFSWYAHPLFNIGEEDYANFTLNFGHFTEFLIEPPVLSGEALITDIENTQMLPDILEFVLFEQKKPYIVPQNYTDEFTYLQIVLLKITNYQFPENEYLAYKGYIQYIEPKPIVVNSIPIIVESDFYMKGQQKEGQKKKIDYIIEDSLLLEVNMQFLMETYKSKLNKLELVLEFYKHDRKGAIKKKNQNEQNQDFIGKLHTPIFKTGLISKATAKYGKKSETLVDINNKKTKMGLDFAIQKKLVSF